MEIPRSVRRPIETIRTAPYGVSVIGFAALGVLGSNYSLLSNVSFSNFVIGALGTGFNAVNAKNGYGYVQDQLSLRDQTEEIAAENEFVEPFFRAHTEHWCDRQTILTALRDSELLPQYQELCKQTEDTSLLTKLPNF